MEIEKKQSMAGRRGGMAERGSSLVELAVATIIILTISAMAILQMRPAQQQSQATGGLDEVKSTLRLARETAISQRRTIVVEFVGTNTIELFQMTVIAGTPAVVTMASAPFLTIPIENTVKFMIFSGEVDTPDKFGLPTVPSGISFPGAVGNPQFQSDGTLTDSNGTPINGTVFLSVPGTTSATGAVTVMGNTGRIRAYHYTGNGWWQ